MHTEAQTSVQADETVNDYSSVEQQLAQAKKEIEDLKLQIMWLERSYE
ncbi:hypothetical protein [Thalassotalea ganghwensis]